MILINKYLVNTLTNKIQPFVSDRGNLNPFSRVSKFYTRLLDLLRYFPMRRVLPGWRQNGLGNFYKSSGPRKPENSPGMKKPHHVLGNPKIYLEERGNNSIRF